MTPGLAYAAALVLAAVFGWAAVAKLRAPAATVSGFASLRVPRPRLLAKAVPGAELGLAAALAVVPVWGAAAALVLLAAFTGVLVANLGRGGSGCNCFGSGPTGDAVSRVEVVRNILLAAAAVLATGAARPAAPSGRDVLAAGVTVALAVAVLRGLRLHHRDRVGGGGGTGPTSPAG